MKPFIALDEQASTPLYQQIYEGIRDQIVSGRLKGGTRLASTRRMATELAVSRFTVVAAFDALRAEGYIHSAPRGGIFVTETLPDLDLRGSGRSLRPPRGPRAPGGSRRDTRSATAGLSQRGKLIGSLSISGPRDSQDGPRPFHPRRAPLDLFPTTVWSRLVRRQWRARRAQMLDYGDPRGLPGLRSAIAEHAANTRGLECSPEQVVITSGAQQAFNLLFELLLDPGDSAWIEEPGYLDARGALTAAGARLVPVPVDQEGIIVSRGIALDRKARLAYVSPSHQYPTGATMSISRRLELLRWAHDAGSWIVEDDYDSYFRYKGRPLPALQRLESEHRDSSGAASSRVAYVGTFSKTMFPSLRLGYCVVPARLAESVANARAIADRNSSLSDQAALEAFIREGHYDRHLRRVRTACLERHDTLVREVARHLGDRLTMSPAAAGTHLLGWLTRGSAISVAKAARDKGLVLFPLSRYCIDRVERDGLVLGYGGSPPRAIEAAVRKLATLIN